MDIGTLPVGSTLVRTTPTFDETTVPAGLLRAHRVADDVWGRVVVHEGALTVWFDDDSGEHHLIGSNDTVVLEPGRPHHVETNGRVRFVVEFHR